MSRYSTAVYIIVRRLDIIFILVTSKQSTVNLFTRANAGIATCDSPSLFRTVSTLAVYVILWEPPDVLQPSSCAVYPRDVQRELPPLWRIVAIRLLVTRAIPNRHHL